MTSRMPFNTKALKHFLIPGKLVMIKKVRRNDR